MRLVYLCTANPPLDSDFIKVQEFFADIPDSLKPRTGTNESDNMLYFAERIGSNWLPEFHDFAVAFLSEFMLTNENALRCIGRAQSAFPNMVGIDLYNNLSKSQIEKAEQYCKRILTFEEGKDFIKNVIPSISSSYDMEAKVLNQLIENDGFKYLNETIENLHNNEKKNRTISYCCYGAALLSLIILIAFTFFRFFSFSFETEAMNPYLVIIISIGVIVLSVLMISTCRFFFLLGKSFMVESIRCADRAHAIGLGKLYLKLYKSKFSWSELRDVLQSWNIDNGSAFRNLDAKDIEGIDKILLGMQRQK